LFQIGFLELILILIIGLIVIGPEKLPDTYKFILKNLKLLRNAFDDAKSEIERNIGADEIKQDIHNEIRLKELEDNEEDSS
jgi:sec-independent protein translocase protein TatB